MKRYLIGLLVMLGLVSGCATMSKDECRAADWRTIGYEDGNNGHTSERLSKHRKACAKANVTPDLDAWENGRAAGLRRFCVPRNAYNKASNGYTYNGVCPSDLEDDFLDAYDLGREHHELKSAVEEMLTSIRQHGNDLDDIEYEIEDAERQLVENDGDPTSRRALVDDIKDLTRDAEYRRIELLALERELEAREYDLEAFLRDRAPVY